MWTTFVSNSDNVARQMQSAFSDAVTAHPVLMAGGVAAFLGMIFTHWVVVIDAELRQLRERRTDRDWPIRSTR